MSDELQNDDLDQSFWDDVDALRAMLEEEDSQQESFLPSSFETEPAPRATGQTAAVHLPSEGQPSGPARSNRPVSDSRNIPQQRMPSHRPSAPRLARTPRRPSKGALITLYTIIIMELGAITAVAYHWYSWIQ